MKKFSNISTSRFRLLDTFQVVTEANTIVKELSGDKINFSDIIDRTLRNQIISRSVSKAFLEENSEVFTKYPYVTISVEVDNEDLIITLGGVPDENDETIFLNGVLEI